MNRFASRLALTGLVGLLAGCASWWPWGTSPAQQQGATAPAAASRVQWRSPEGGKVYFTSNDRDKSAYDLYVRDAQSGRVELVCQNPGDVVQWIPDVDGSVGARVRRQDDINILQVMNPATHTWRSVYKWRHGESPAPQRVDRSGSMIHMVSSVIKY